MINIVTIEGVTGPSGVRYVCTSHHDISVCVPIARLSSDERGSKTTLAEAGILLFGTDWRKFIEKVRNLREFPEAAVIESVGWNGADFVLPDGEVISGGGQGRSYRAIAFHKAKCSQAGTFSGWKTEVASTLQGQELAIFFLMTAFMPPLLRLTDRAGNVGFELVGPKGAGKSTLQYLVSSVLGGVVQGSGGHYWVTLDTTYNALEDSMRIHSDLPLIMDEANLLAAGSPARVRGDVFQALAFKLFSGSLKGRFGAPAETDYRLGYVISSNEPLASLLGQSNESARAAADRLITLPVDLSRRPFGVFDSLPANCKSSGVLAQYLMRAAIKHHGHAIRKFLKKLVKARAADENGLRRKIRRHVEKFQEKAGVNFNDGSAVRVAEAFGIVYAAGKLAQKFGVLPAELDPCAAALASYQLHLAHIGNHHADFRARLHALLADDRIVSFENSDTPPPGALAYIALKKKELWVPADNITELFADWARIKRSREVNSYLIREASAYKIKRRLPGLGQSRIYCFKLPSGSGI